MGRRDPAASVYAQALSEAGGAACEGPFDAFLSAWNTLPDFRAFLLAPNVPAGAKRKALSEVFDGIFLDFLCVVIDKGRVPALPSVHEAFRALRDKAAGRVRAKAATAEALTPPQALAVRETLAGRLGRQVVLEEAVRPELMGGLKLQIGDWVADGTLQRRLRDLARAVASARAPLGAWES